MRAEIDFKVNKEYSWVLWEGKTQVPELKKLGCLSGLMVECVNQGSQRRGLPKMSRRQLPTFCENELAVSPGYVFLSGFISQENLTVLTDMASSNLKKDRCILFPGVVVVHQSESDAFKHFRKEHKSRSLLENVCFRVMIDTEQGRPNTVNPEEQFGTL